MTRTLIDRLPCGVPEELAKIASGARMFDSSSSSEARVYFIDRDGGYYLKTSKAGSLAAEEKMTDYFHKKGLGAATLGYVTCDDADWLLTERVRGEDCTHEMYKSDPKRLCDLLANELRRLHELDLSDCPIQDRMSTYIVLAEENYKTGNYSTEHFPDNFGYSTADEAFGALQAGKNELKNEVLLHGDYCFPNVMLDDWNLSGFIDLGNGGVGDRHIDLFWGAWSLGFNLGTDRYRERFFDAYGRDKIDENKLKTIAAAEVFG